MKMPKNDADYCQMLSFAFGELAKAKRQARIQKAKMSFMKGKLDRYEPKAKPVPEPLASEE